LQAAAARHGRDAGEPGQADHHGRPTQVRYVGEVAEPGFGRGGGGGGPGGFGMLPIDIDSFQLFFDVTTKTRPGTKVTFLLPHLNGSEDEGCGS